MTKAWHQRFNRSSKAARTFAGEVFDSASEGRRWMELRRMEDAGLISDLQRQVSYKLFCGDAPIKYASGRQATYTADFVYRENGQEVVEEYKGFDDPTSKLRRAVFSAMSGHKIKMTGAKK